jgi:predicted regulator of Ras-like GTPase activity (Roadblock/LC7/MglB family)
MVFGYNHNLKHKGEIFHVQTEDSGVTNPHIVTLLYRGGAVISSKKTSYSDILKMDNLPAVLKELMKEQHIEKMRRLKSGEFDEKAFASKPQPVKSHESEILLPEVNMVATSLSSKSSADSTSKGVLINLPPISSSTCVEKLSPEIQDQLKELSRLEGFAGVGLFTPTGELLAVQSADNNINFKEIGMLANNVLMNAQKASLEMGAGRGEQVHVQTECAHILVRCLNEGTDPLKSQPGKAHIHLVLILTTDSSIGLAKIKINKVIAAVAGEFRM